MGIFLTYGLSLGIVGSGVGMVLGLLFVFYINQIAGLLGRITGQRGLRSRRFITSSKFRRSSNRSPWRWIVAGAMSDRGVGQHSAGPSRGPPASCGGIAL